jgi:hypothetical protein
LIAQKSQREDQEQLVASLTLQLNHTKQEKERVQEKLHALESVLDQTAYDATDAKQQLKLVQKTST